MDISLLFAAITGLIFGFFFGCSFIYQQRAIFGPKQTSLTKPIALFVGRILLLMAFGYHLLPLPLFSSIIGLVLFITAYWLTILTLKARGYARL